LLSLPYIIVGIGFIIYGIKKTRRPADSLPQAFGSTIN